MHYSGYRPEERLLSRKRNFEDTLDGVINNPAYDMLGGYQIFIRRMAIPTFILIFALIIWSITSNKILTAFITGIAIGPILNFDRAIAHWFRLRKIKNE